MSISVTVASETPTVTVSGDDITVEIGAVQGASGTAGGLTYSGSIPNATVRTYYLNAYVTRAHTVATVYGLQTTSGTATVTLKKNGSGVTGWTSLSVTSTPQNVSASAAVSLAVGDVFTLVVDAASSPVDLRLAIPGTAV